MGLEYSSGFCEVCNSQKKIGRKTPNHLLHFLIAVFLGIFTAGIGAIFWIFIWILVSIRFGGWYCSSCGSKKVNKDIEYRKIVLYGTFALIIVFGKEFFIKEKIETIEKEVDIETLYKVIDNSIKKEECIDKSIDFIMNKQESSSNIQIKSQETIEKDEKNMFFNATYTLNGIEKSFTAKCEKTNNNIVIHEIEDIETQ